jgi:hypothetical protein
MAADIRALVACALISGMMMGPGAAAATRQPHKIGAINLPTTPPPRSQVQYLLRRFSFSDNPEDTTAVQNMGIDPWLAYQDNWQAIDDSNSELETLPTQLQNGGYPDYNIFERAVVQHMILTQRQLQAKLELHWLDHFSVSLAGVGDPAIMYHYDQTVRANALGNFATLLTAVAQEPAMLIWLNNNYNAGSAPNENFAREVMQLYTMGLYQLNADGSQVTDGKGQPVPTYAEPDVKAGARAMTGYGVVIDPNNNNPQTRVSVQYFSGNHYTGKIRYLGQDRKIPNDGTAIQRIMAILVNEPTTAPFEVKELLQRFVTENPSPEYVSAITAVWLATAKAPDQIAQVINAIVDYPEFPTAYRSMPKQPAEMVFGALRQVPGVMQSTVNVTPGSSLLYELSGIGQQLFWPATVFSFYRPGNIETTENTGSVLYRTSVFANITNAQQSGAYTDTYIDVPTLRTRIGATDGATIATYLLDAFVDGGSPQLQTLLQSYLGRKPSDNQLLGGIWLMLNSPDYSVN